MIDTKNTAILLTSKMVDIKNNSILPTSKMIDINNNAIKFTPKIVDIKIIGYFSRQTLLFSRTTQHC